MTIGPRFERHLETTDTVCGGQWGARGYLKIAPCFLLMTNGLVVKTWPILLLSGSRMYEAIPGDYFGLNYDPSHMIMATYGLLKTH